MFCWAHDVLLGSCCFARVMLFFWGHCVLLGSWRFLDHVVLLGSCCFARGQWFSWRHAVLRESWLLARVMAFVVGIIEAENVQVSMPQSHITWPYCWGERRRSRPGSSIRGRASSRARRFGTYTIRRPAKYTARRQRWEIVWRWERRGRFRFDWRKLPATTIPHRPYISGVLVRTIALKIAEIIRMKFSCWKFSTMEYRTCWFN